MVAFMPQEQTTLLRCLQRLERERERESGSANGREDEGGAAAGDAAASTAGAEDGDRGEEEGETEAATDAQVTVARVSKRRRDDQGSAGEGRASQRRRQGQSSVAAVGRGGGLAQTPVRTWVGWGWRGAPLASRALGPRW